MSDSGRGLGMDVSLEKLRMSTEGARRQQLLNLSGKRTEEVYTDESCHALHDADPGAEMPGNPERSAYTCIAVSSPEQPLAAPFSFARNTFLHGCMQAGGLIVQNNFRRENYVRIY